MEENNNEKVTNEVTEEKPVVEEQDVVTSTTSVTEQNNSVNEKKKSKMPFIIIGAILLVGIIVLVCFLLLGGGGEKKNNDKKDDNGGTIVTPTDQKASPFRLSGNGLENFDLEFLKLEDNGKNVVYSPLSIKYMLAMLNEGTEGNSNAQIKALIGDYKPNKYTNSSNMSLANVMFVRNSFKDKVKQTYADVLKEKYNADVVYDEFKNPDNVNKWVSDKTFGLIDKFLDKVDEIDLFYVINSLAIDMDWYSNFIPEYNRGYTGYASYDHTNFHWATNNIPQPFENLDERVDAMDVGASFAKYDVIKENGGEDAYRKKVNDWLVNCVKEYGEDIPMLSDEFIQSETNSVVKAMKEMYGKEALSTDFSFYVDDDIKVFAKDLKEYNGKTLQYIGFMPVNENLDTFVKNIDAKKLTEYIGKLKEVKSSNFKDGENVIITGYIPKFKYEYELNFKEDLKKLGVEDIFDPKLANLSKITDENVFINKAIHKATIYFNQDGIKASATTLGGGAGNANGPCHYVEDLPITRIDITFNKPYMYIVRDKSTGEVWFTGSVYQPLKWNEVEDQQ